MTQKKHKGWGQIINHSSKALFVIETDSGPAIAHILGPKMKTSNGLDADGFKRADGETLLRHKHWWKIGSGFTANIYQIGSDFLLPISFAVPVPDQQFGSYTIDRSPGWGVELAYVTSIIRDKKRKTIGYMTEKYGEVSRTKGVQLALQGKLDNVDVVHNKDGKAFLRSKRNSTSEDNLA